MSPSNTLVPVIDLPFLASEVNDAHRQVTFHAKSMLLEAKRAGEALLAAKQMVKHGEFKAWVEANCRCSYRTAAKYMAVARAKDAEVGTFGGGVDAFLEAQATPRTAKPTPQAHEMDTTDAEYLLKLHAMATRGSENERDVAARKLAQRAEAFALSPEAAIAQAKALLPDSHKSADQIAREAAAQKLKATEERLAEVEAKLERMMHRKAELRSQFTGLSRDELLEMLVDAYLQLDPIDP